MPNKLKVIKSDAYQRPEPALVLCAQCSRWQDLKKSVVLAFILARVKAQPDPTPGTLGMRWEHILNGMPVHCRAPCTQSQ